MESADHASRTQDYPVEAADRIGSIEISTWHGDRMGKLWKVACQEDVFPGMWQRWFRHQCVAVGWPKAPLKGQHDHGRGWSAARNALIEMQIGDWAVVALRDNRLGRLGLITEKLIDDHLWSPLVPKGPGLPDGEMGRRVLVRWDLTVGPDNSDLVVHLPKDNRLSSGELRPTVSQIRSLTLAGLISLMNDRANWVNLLGSFSYEKALSDFIANYPNRLEDGFLPHPNSKIRERVFRDKTRLDVLLIDSAGKPVIVECKQYAPNGDDLKQLRHYMDLFVKEVGTQPRGMLVHGGAAKLPAEIEKLSNEHPRIEIVNYNLDVNFRRSSRW